MADSTKRKTFFILALAFSLVVAAVAVIADEDLRDKLGNTYYVFGFVIIGCVALVLPATLDWAYGRFHPHRFPNAWRTATGILLGLGLGRSLFIHVQRPMPPALLAQALVVTCVALPVILTAYRRNRRG